MNVLLIGSDKNLGSYLPESMFTVNYFQDLYTASEYNNFQRNDALILDLCSCSEQHLIPLPVLLQKQDIPVIILINKETERISNNILKNDTYHYLVKNELNSNNLCRLLINAGISGAMKKKQFNINKYNELYELFFKNFPLGIFILNNDKRIVYCNTRVEEILNLNKTQLDSYFLTQFLYPDDIPHYIESINALTGNRKHNAVLESRFLAGKGDPCWQRLYISITSALDNEADYFLIITSDITKEKEKEALLHVFQKSIEEANKAKIEFLANISHEVRTPIHTIVGMTELLLDTNLNKEQKKYIKQIRFSSETLLTLINHVLDFSRIESGQFDIKLIEFNLYRMIENSIDLIIQDINRKSIEMILFIDSNVPEFVKGDPVHLHQIIRNLLNNAVKFTDEGEIFLSITRVKTNDSKIILGFSLRDTGIGIDAHKIKDIFNLFFQVDSSLTKNHMGTGVGLSIVKKLVELLNGKIEVESQKGQGSHFYFEIPFEEYDEVLVSTDIRGKPFKGLKVLTVDDNKRVMDILHKYLSAWGCSVKEISMDRLKAAIQEKKTADLLQNFDLCLINLNTCEIENMFQLADSIKRTSPDNKEDTDAYIDSSPEHTGIKTKLILLKPMGLLRYKDTEKLLQWFDSCISKPVRKRDLFDVINKLIKSSTAAAPDIQEEINSKAHTATIAIADHKVHILVVEDHEVNREFFCTILNKLGYEVIKANNGMEAVHIMDNYQFDLIFMDIQMPGMNGYEVTRHFRKNGIKAPIIAVTANTIRGEIARCLQAGMNDYLAKPFRKNDLVPLINKWLKNANLNTTDYDTEPTAEDLSIFNFDKAIEMFMGQKSVVLKLLNPFVERLAEQIAAMKLALKNKDYITIQHEAHTIKGGALNIQAMEMGTCALELEILAREKEEEKLRPKLVELEQTYQHFKTAVAAVMKNNS